MWGCVGGGGDPGVGGGWGDPLAWVGGGGMGVGPCGYNPYEGVGGSDIEIYLQHLNECNCQVQIHLCNEAAKKHSGRVKCLPPDGTKTA